MRKLLLLAVSLVLTGCSFGSTPLAFPTATTAPSVITSLTAPAATVTLAPTQTTPGAPTAVPSDLFAANYIQLSPPVCNGLTPEQTEGLYYKPGSPERQILLEESMTGEKLIVAGYVVDQNCQPIPGALLDFWQADANGQYDNNGFTLRGHQLTDSQGRYFLETVMPGEYPGRTDHIHVKIQPPGGSVLTTQLYFPDVPANSTDSNFNPALLVTLEHREGLYVAYFNFAVPGPAVPGSTGTVSPSATASP